MRQQFKILSGKAKRSGQRLQEVALFDEAGEPLELGLPGSTGPEGPEGPEGPTGPEGAQGTSASPGAVYAPIFGITPVAADSLELWLKANRAGVLSGNVNAWPDLGPNAGDWPAPSPVGAPPQAGGSVAGKPAIDFGPDTPLNLHVLSAAEFTWFFVLSTTVVGSSGSAHLLEGGTGGAGAIVLSATRQIMLYKQWTELLVSTLAATSGEPTVIGVSCDAAGHVCFSIGGVVEEHDIAPQNFTPGGTLLLADNLDDTAISEVILFNSALGLADFTRLGRNLMLDLGV